MVLCVDISVSSVACHKYSHKDRLRFEFVDGHTVYCTTVDRLIVKQLGGRLGWVQ